VLSILDQQLKLTHNQYKLVAAAIFGFGLEFLDYFLIAFILTFVTAAWKLSFGASAAILLSSGVGAIIGAVYFGCLADRIGRRSVFMITIATLSLGTGALALTPESAQYGWPYLIAFRFVMGLGVGGLVCVDLPLVQEFMPVNKRGMVTGLITSSTPVAFFIGSIMVAYLAPYVGWRGLMVICFALSFITLIIRSWVPESPRWLILNNRPEEARRSIAWALEVAPETLPAASDMGGSQETHLSALFRYPRSVLVSWLINLGAQTGYYGLTLWTPTLLVQLLGISPEQAAIRMMALMLCAFAGRLTLSISADRFGRRNTGVFCSFGAAVALSVAAYSAHFNDGAAFLPLLMAAYFFGEGGFAVLAPYSAEVWPAALRTSGLGSAYGFGGVGKIIGPLGLALVIGSSNLVLPKTTSEAVTPAFLYFAVWYVLAGLAYLAFGIETRGRSLEAISDGLKMDKRPPPMTDHERFVL
jgi:putative MFS transporter